MRRYTRLEEKWWVNRYCVGFAFTPGLENVVLIAKRRPLWQAGHLNGVGGRAEETDQFPRFAMAREFKEETDLQVDPNRWNWTEVLEFSDGLVLDVFATVLYRGEGVRTMTDELICIWPLKEVLGMEEHPVLRIQSKIRYAMKKLENDPVGLPRFSMLEYQI